MEPAKSIPDKLFYKIGEVCEHVGVQPHVLRYWESEFPMLAPQKNRAGQRVYRRKDLEMHPTVKPVALVADAMRDCSNRDGIVLDSFGGSGTTLVAAHMTGRRGYVMEIDPVYVDVSIRRFEKFTGIGAVLAETGQPFAEVAAERQATPSPSRRRRQHSEE